MDPANINELQRAMTALIENTIFHDGQAETNTPFIEELERAVHNITASYRPSHPDSQALRCYWGCDYCMMFDAAKE